MKGNLEFGYTGKKRSWKVEASNVLNAAFALFLLALMIKQFVTGDILWGFIDLVIGAGNAWLAKFKFTYTKLEKVSK